MMKKIILGSSLTLVAVAMSIAPALAHGNHGPCAPVWEACVAKLGKGKDAKSCVETIKSGKTVDGVTVSDADAKACAAAPAHGKGKPKDAPAADSSGANPS